MFLYTPHPVSAINNILQSLSTRHFKSPMSFLGLIVHFLLLLSNIPLYMCTLFIHSSIERHRGYLRLLMIMNKSAINIHVQYFCGYKFLNKLSKYLGMQLMDPDKIHLVRSAQLSFKVAATLCIPNSKWMRIIIALHPYQQLKSVCFKF